MFGCSREWPEYDFLVGEAPQAPLAEPAEYPLFLYAGPALHVYDDLMRLVRVHFCNDHHVWHFKGGKGHERLVKWATDNCNVNAYYFAGQKGCERIVRHETTSTKRNSQWQTTYYEGPRRNEYKVRAVDRDTGAVRHYERVRARARAPSWPPRPREVLVRQVHPDGHVFYFKRCQLIRAVYADGRVMRFDPFYLLQGQERADAYNHVNPFKHHVEPNGTVHEYDRAKSQCEDDELLRIVYPNGTIKYFYDWYNSWHHHTERYLLAVEHPDGQVCYPKPDWPASFPVIYSYALSNGEPLDWAAYSTAYRWARVREWVKKRAIAVHWQERTQMRLAAPGGAGRAADLEAFVTDFGALSV